MNDSTVQQSDPTARWMKGELSRDDRGADPAFIRTVLPFFKFLYRDYWRVETSGLQNVPDRGRALLVSNHSGLLPWDGFMISTAVLLDHPAARLVHTLYGAFIDRLPYASTFMAKLGQVVATADNGARLLERDRLVGVFPEGYKGLGKTYRERYQLARFGHGGFARLALRTGAPIIPVAVVGAEESYVMFSGLPSLSRLVGLPYFPVSLTGFVPLPAKWHIGFGEPVSTQGFGPGAEKDLRLVSDLSDLIRTSIQNLLYTRLSQRRSVYFR